MSTSIPQLILWPTLITLGVNLLRLTFELQGLTTTQTGGGLSPLGISWLAFLFGAFFALRLRAEGDRPRLRWAWVWALVLFVALATTVAIQFGPIDRTDTSAQAYAQLRSGVQTIVLVAVPLAMVAFAVWPRLAAALALYGLVARVTVVVLTWLAKGQGWDTHYTKFGPAGIEQGMGETLFAASFAQLGFWVPFTVVAGLLFGSIVAAFGREPRTED